MERGHEPLSTETMVELGGHAGGWQVLPLTTNQGLPLLGGLQVAGQAPQGCP
jgi:hypothetical protein